MNEEMHFDIETDKKSANKSGNWLGLFISLLAVAIIVSAAFLGTRLAEHSLDDDNAIALVPDDVSDIQDAESETQSDNAINSGILEDTIENTELADNSISGDVDNTLSTEHIAEPITESSEIKVHSISDDVGFVFTEQVRPTNPGIEVGDGQKIWSTETVVDIFKITYENGEAVVTVDGGSDKVLAPGTENAYTFYLKNTGDVKLDYEVTLEAYFSPEEYTIPVVARLKGYDGSYLLGSEGAWEDVLALNYVKDAASLGINHYAYYTLEWQWPFEWGDDAFDTYLGNEAVEKDIQLTIVIRTVATGESETGIEERPNMNGEITHTGDQSNLAVWILVAVIALGLCAGLLVLRMRQKSQKEPEQVDDTKETRK